MSAPRPLCYNKLHHLPAGKTRCQSCNTQASYRLRARKTGAGLCPNNHGLIAGNLDFDGACAECRALGLHDGFPPVHETWLDWAAVLQALQGKPLLRGLSKRELACMITTVYTRNAGWTYGEVATWIDDNTCVAGMTKAYAEYLVWLWWRRAGYPDPRVALERAVLAEVDGDAWVAAAEAGGAKLERVA